MVEKSAVEKGGQGKGIINPLPNGYCPKQVEDGVKVLFQVLEKAPKKSLFEDEGEYIQLQVSSIRIPKNRKKHYRFVLPHGFLKDTAEVCLFVKNLSKNDREYDNTVRHFKNLLSEAGVTRVSEVVSVNQLMQEYKTYEMKRRLAARFDMFLADNAVSNWLHGALGKGFHRCRKQPNPINMHSKNLKDEIDKALMKTTLTVSGNGAQFMAKIGHTKQSVEKICQNIDAFVKGLRYTMPGKWRNVRSLLIRTEDSIAVPIYYSFANPNGVKVPKQALPPVRKTIPMEKDEISTLPDGYEVMVLPSGDVRVHGKKSDGTMGWLSDVELRELGDFEPLNDDDDELNEEGGEELVSDSEEDESVEQVEKEEDDDYSDSEEDEAAVEAAEDAYLKELSAGKVTKPSKQKLEESHPSSQKLTETHSNKRKLEKLDSLTAEKKPKNVGKVKNSIPSDWKVEVIPSSNKSMAENRKCVRNFSNSWKVDEVVQLTELKKKNSAMEGSVGSKGEKVKKEIGMPNGFKVKSSVSNFGTKGKISGNKLGTKRKLKVESKK